MMFGKNQPPYDVAIIGGGFYGVRTALALAAKGLKICLLEREPRLLQRASYANQSRVHNGYHYPRSAMTAFASRKHYKRFSDEFAPYVRDDFRHLYAIARKGSKVSAYQFERFCQRVGIPLAPARTAEKKLFEPKMVEQVYHATEVAIDTAALGQALAEKLLASPVETRLSMAVTRVREAGNHKGFVVALADGTELTATGVINATYAGLNPLLAASGFAPMPLKTELAEMCLVRLPAVLENTAVTVMDGPFFSLMPFGSDGLYTFSHVRYTPHVAWDDKTPQQDPYAFTERYRQTAKTRFAYMRNDAAKYLPALQGLVYVDSLLEAKAVPIKNEKDDGRPILFYTHAGTFAAGEPFFVSLLGAKLDNIYEWEEVLEGQFGAEAVSA